MQPMLEPPPTTSKALRSKVLFALLAVYAIWGSTYLALRFALESFPPFLLGGTRYTLAGAGLYAFARRRGARAPTAVEWRGALLVGTLLFTLGNGLVAVATQLSIASGVAAIVVATTTLWAVLFAMFWGTRPTGGELAGLALGLVGVGLLQRGGAFHGSPGGMVAVVLAPVAWALGSIWGARMRLPAGHMGAATQMICGGGVMVLMSFLLDEHMKPVTLRALLALAYLMVFGSLVAFSAYRFLLQHTRPAVATSYAFVNPMVALLLGATLAAEPLTPHHMVACGLTVVAVLFVLRSRARGP